MESYNYIESGLILAIKTLGDLNQIKFSARDFSIQGKAFEFIGQYLEENKEAPPKSLLETKFPEIDLTATGLGLSYCIENFHKQILARKIFNAFKDNQDFIKEDPKKAITQILEKLDEVSLTYDDDIFILDTGDESRFEDYQSRKKARKRGLKIIGIPTIFRSINKTGIGWTNGQLITIFAYTSIGKTWLLAQSAAVAVRYGYRTLFITTEMPIKQMSLRLDVLLGRQLKYSFSHRGIQRGELLSQEEESYRNYLKNTTNRKMMICESVDNGRMTLPGIKKMVRKHRPDLLIVDGLCILPGQGRESSWERMEYLFYGIKNDICIPHNIPVMASTQANTSAAMNLYAPPRFNQIGYGQGGLRAADEVFSMSLVEDDEKARLVQYQKKRDDSMSFNYVILDWDVDKGIIQERQTHDELAQDSSGENESTDSRF